MPVKDGGMVLQEVSQINPDQKVLIASAFSRSWFRQLNLNSRNVRVLQKPFELQVLMDNIIKVFEGNASR